MKYYGDHILHSFWDITSYRQKTCF